VPLQSGWSDNESADVERAPSQLIVDGYRHQFFHRLTGRARDVNASFAALATLSLMTVPCRNSGNQLLHKVEPQRTIRKRRRF
jgi:hypothetical protein